jgi:hypothetical protein
MQLPDNTTLHTFLPPTVTKQVTRQLDLSNNLNHNKTHRITTTLHPSYQLTRATITTHTTTTNTTNRLTNPELTLNFEHILANIPHH